jgi:succinate dehydrogenase/fumarate reductase flavoprotein subunit
MFEEAPNIVKELSEMGVGFDEDAEGNLEQRPFGGASANRTCYIADRTGASIVRTLLVKCRDEGVPILSNHKFLNITQYNGKLSSFLPAAVMPVSIAVTVPTLRRARVTLLLRRLGPICV